MDSSFTIYAYITFKDGAILRLKFFDYRHLHDYLDFHKDDIVSYELDNGLNLSKAD